MSLTNMGAKWLESRWTWFKPHFCPLPSDLELILDPTSELPRPHL